MATNDQDQPPVSDGVDAVTHTRRRAIKLAAAGLVTLGAGAAAAFELIDHGVLPGKLRLDQILGDCHVPAPQLTVSNPGPSRSGTFFSKARNQTVGYTIAYPPGHGPGSKLPLAVALHGYGGNHNMSMGNLSLAGSLAAKAAGQSLPAFALVSVDGGGLYWNPHPRDNPMAMIVDELIPMCQKLGLGTAPGSIGTIGDSMGGYGSLLLAERHPTLVSAAAAISPAIWTSYSQAHAANPGAYASAADFARDDVVTHASVLSRTPVRIASGVDDPFHPGVVAIADACPSSVIVHFSAGCHAGSFFVAQAHPSLAFVGRHLTHA